MKLVLTQYRCLILASFIGLTVISFARKKEVEEDLSQIDPARIPTYDQPEVKAVTKVEKKKNCQRYRNKLIAYTEDLYYVTSRCQRQLLSHEDSVKRLAQGETPLVVDGRVIQSFALKKAAVVTSDLKKRLKTYEGQCIMFDQLVYRIEKGKKRLYPDWESVQAAKCPLNQLTQGELDQIPPGEVMASVLDKEQSKEIEVVDRDLIPTDKLCDYLPKTWYAFHEKLFEKKKEKTHCYLQEVRVELGNDRIKQVLAKTRPVELSQQLFRSVALKWLPTSTDSEPKR